MFLQYKKLVPTGLIGALFLLLLASGCAGNGSSNGNTQPGSISQQGSTPIATITPQLVTPKSSGGSQGKGPLLIFSPTPVPGGQAGSEEVVLADRTLIISSARKQNGTSANSSLIYLDLAVQNTSGKVIMNQPGFFQLIGPEGDIFDYQYNSSDNFYGGVPAHTTRSGTIVFQVPAAATSNLSLLYRPEIATESAIIVLTVR
jgi:hypothetical protein